MQPDSDVTVEAAAAPSLTELTAPDAEHALDDFAAEPDQPSLEDSPREVARKVIAARKRQSKKPEKVVEVVADTETPPIIVPEAAPVAGALFEEARIDVPVEAPPTVQESLSIRSATPDSTDVPAEVAGGGRGSSFLKWHRGFSKRSNSSQRSLNSPSVSSPSTSSGPVRRPQPSRIAGWTRVPEKPSLERHDRLLTPLASEVDSIDSDIPPPMLGDAGQVRQRLEMLPLALVLGLGLVIGYAAGYVVGNREQPQLASAATETQRPASPPPSRAQSSRQATQAPTTGSSTPRAATEQIVPREGLLRRWLRRRHPRPRPPAFRLHDQRRHLRPRRAPQPRVGSLSHPTRRRRP